VLGWWIDRVLPSVVSGAVLLSIGLIVQSKWLHTKLKRTTAEQTRDFQAKLNAQTAELRGDLEPPI
jgi:xanthine/uracil permease